MRVREGGIEESRSEVNEPSRIGEKADDERLNRID
jgi:hypothetical protein